MSIFFIRRKIDPQPYIERAKVMGIRFNTALKEGDKDEALYTAPRLMENVIKYAVALKGGRPLSGVNLDIHLPYLIGKIEDREDYEQARRAIINAFQIYSDMAEERFSYLRENGVDIELGELECIFRDFVDNMEVYLEEELF
ncbi:MAG TPA: hypothetical protein ENG29_01115 [Firmicutes bacterium]|uniref:Uncharacterized protein n=1 Tax=Candidatus Coatesbacteria bacterium 4484_99 TaxID=1970774 RepID=A0A1W9S054_9BACT|nr:MAG: hypothetical protein B6D57_04240 [Candidatus Coatesbacteria bacterium 4484_99]RLC43052.1 MAG: hypothetical protein DRH49_02370 [Candidatus Coatesbacteria bacterium]RLC44255.1 MAG: hypothetical protein DRH44_02935 [Candidatus Coatesbacteria bacterium]HDM42968.1 hypothetical protein [Bacillota bacterium]